MKKLFQLAIVILILFSLNIALASNDDSLMIGEKLMPNDTLTKISEKVVLFFKQNPSKGNLTLEDLLKENVISSDDYKFLIKNQIKYTPPSSAGPHDNYLAVFDRNNENVKSVHGRINIMDTSDGTLSELDHFVSEWYGSNSANKNLFLFKNRNLVYFTLRYWDNDIWDKQHIMLIDFPEDSIDDIEKFKKMMNVHDLRYREDASQKSFHFTVWLPSDLSVIKKLSNEILTSIYLLSEEDVIKFTPDGFRFDLAKNN